MRSLWNYIAILIAAVFNGCAANLPPIFTMDMNNLVIPENIPVDTVIYRLQGSDPENSPVHFGLEETDVLSVNRTSGEVTVVKPLDYEKNNTLNIIVSIEDEVEGGGKNNIVEVPITVIISDENDNPPEFIKAPYEITVNEDTLPGTKVFSEIMVVDKDTIGSNIEVECINLPIDLDACDIFNVEVLTSEQNSYLGAITLQSKLDYNDRKIYSFALKASDGELTNTTKVTIIVGDVQDKPPYFVGNLTAEISEDVDINTLIMTVHAEDGDRGIPRKISYELESNPMDYIILDSTTGELRTARPIDKESIDNPDGILTFTVKAYELENGFKMNDPLTVTSAQVTIKVLDVNDEPPSFNKREYDVQVPENIEVGSPLPGLDMTVRDPDEVRNNSAFSLELNDISEVFSIEPKTAIGSTPVTIRVANSSLDYEDFNQRKFIILAIAKEIYTKEKLSSTATVTITVIDVNDNAPSFDQDSYSATISEMATPGSLVTTITATDRDSGQFGENGIIYILTGNGADKFVVNNRTGTITIADCKDPGKSPCLDFETKSEYHLQFLAIDDDGKGRTTAVPLNVHLTDSNDNPPIFIQPTYRAFINEGSVKFDPELMVEAIDADKTSRVKYAIISGNDDGLFGIIPSTGIIRINNNRGLDISNETDNTISLTIMASDGQYTSTALVNITVLDVNNNPPIFIKQHYVKSVEEDVPIGTSVLKVEATDADTGDNSAVEYFIQKGGYDDFEINNTSGWLLVAKKLDYDRRNTYNIEVAAVDHGVPSLTGTTNITITVVNVNDKMPYFVPTTQKVEVLEDVPVGTVIYTLIALDPDVNSSEALNFAATEPITALDKHGNEVGDEKFKEFFSIDKNTGQVTVNSPLLRDIAAVIRITILVTDITAPTVQQGQGLLVITIGDVNDSPPKFNPPWSVENPVYYLELKEELPVGTIVATYKAIDEDSDIAGYIIHPKSEYFEINNGTGIVQIKKKIDYEQIKTLNFTIFAFDTGVPQLNTSALVLVKVLNINDNDPIFTNKEYKANIDENSGNGSFVVAVKAIDKDAEKYGEVSYLLTGEHSEFFAIDNETGYITVANSNFLDHEVINETVIQVVAQDGAPSNLRRSVSVPVYITINDVNDNAPIFAQKEYNVTVMENVRLNPPIPLIQVIATDADSEMNGNIHYSIVSGNDNDVFLLGVETGILYPHKSLLGQTKNFNLTVEARDEAGNGKLFDEATINVQVLNVNEHQPEFIMPALPNATVEVLENAATEDYLVMTVKATDKDDHENGRLTYHFKLDNENVQETAEFTIDPNSGELKTRKILDRELQPQYQLVLVARDHGFPKWYETIRHLTVLLVDENDNRPEFPGSKSTNPYHFFVSENNDRNLLIGQVKALDRDEGNHAKVYYYIISGNDDQEFYLDRTGGDLYANKSFDREQNQEYNLLILATNDPNFVVLPDQGEIDETDRSIALVKVTINDLNDNPPIFERSIYYSAANAMANINEFVVNVTATDPDFGANGSITYYIKATYLYKFNTNISSGSIIPSPFNISDKGEICTASYLAENNQHRFAVDVIARENAFPERQAFAKVYIWVFEAEQLIRVILSRPKDEVVKEKDEIIAELSNATQSLVIIDQIRYHIDDNGVKNEDWSDLYILVVNPKKLTILPVPEVLKTIDSKYDFLREYYAGFAIENVVPAFVTEKAETFDSSLVALIALLVVLLVGIITFILVCCCLRHWVLSPTDLKQKDALIKKAIVDDLNTTENPLWIEQKLKIYEEQELTMQVFNEPEQNLNNRRNSDDYINEDNAYATIQHPNRRGSHLTTMSIGADLADYATLSGHPNNRNESNNSSLRGGSNYYEAAMGFQGSTFQVPDRLNGHYGAKFDGSELTINKDRQHEFVAELI